MMVCVSCRVFPLSLRQEQVSKSFLIIHCIILCVLLGHALHINKECGHKLAAWHTVSDAVTVTCFWQHIGCE